MWFFVRLVRAASGDWPPTWGGTTKMCTPTHARELQHVGLIEESEDKLFCVPWDVIVTELPLLAKTI
jgi:hypothetical protein